MHASTTDSRFRYLFAWLASGEFVRRGAAGEAEEWPLRMPPNQRLQRPGAWGSRVVWLAS